MVEQGDVAEPVRVTMSLQEQADFVLSLHDRTKLSDGGAGDAYLILTTTDADALYALGHRLARIAPFEAEVRALVTGAQS